MTTITIQTISRPRNWSRSRRLLSTPSRSSSFLCNRLALGRREFLGSRFSAPFSVHLPIGRMPLRLADRVLSIANGNVENLFGKLDGVSRTLRHEPSMPQSTEPIPGSQNEIETLPKDRRRCE